MHNNKDRLTKTLSNVLLMPRAFSGNLLCQHSIISFFFDEHKK